MLIEIKVKVARNIDSRIRKKVETYLVDKEFFSEAEYAVNSDLEEQLGSHLIESYDVQSMKASSIREIHSQHQGEYSFIATLKDVFVDDDGTEKPIKYKILLWADSLSEANQNVQEIIQQGYNMHIEGIKEVDYIYLENTEDEPAD